MDFSDIERSCSTVNQTYSKENNSRCKRSHQEVFHSRLVAFHVEPVARGEYVQCDGKNFDSEEEHRQVSEVYHGNSPCEKEEFYRNKIRYLRPDIRIEILAHGNEENRQKNEQAGESNRKRIGDRHFVVMRFHLAKLLCRVSENRDQSDQRKRYNRLPHIQDFKCEAEDA